MQMTVHTEAGDGEGEVAGELDRGSVSTAWLLVAAA